MGDGAGVAALHQLLVPFLARLEWLPAPQREALGSAFGLAGQAMSNRTLVADSAETAFCAFTSAATLLGRGLNAWLG